jgi:hypothetical protein
MIPERHARPDDAIRADLNAGPQFRARINNRRGMNARRHHPLI